MCFENCILALVKLETDTNHSTLLWCHNEFIFDCVTHLFNPVCLLKKMVNTIVQQISISSFISTQAIYDSKINSYFSCVFSGLSSGGFEENLCINVLHKPFFSSSICWILPDRRTLHSSTVTPVKLVSLTRGNFCLYALLFMRAKLSYIWSHFSGSEIWGNNCIVFLFCFFIKKVN